MDSIQQNILALRQHIHELEARYHREKNSVKLLAVSKHQSIEKIISAHEVQQNAFAENYLQEALTKINLFCQEKIEWHFIGPIQSNKTKKIAEHFHWVQSVDKLSIAKRLNEQRPLHLPPLNICLQVNISGEKTKSGTAPDDLFLLAQECRLLKNISLRGLMAIPAPKINFDEQREQFKAVKQLYDLFCEKGFIFDTLSMGMSNDLEAAIAEGSTLVRVGTAIFGPRI